MRFTNLRIYELTHWNCKSINSNSTIRKFVNSSIGNYPHLIAVNHDARSSTVGERAEEHRLRERLLHFPLDQPRHRPRSERAIETCRCEPRARQRIELDRH